MVQQLAPLVVAGVLIGAFLVLVGARRLGLKIVGWSLLVGAFLACIIAAVSRVLSLLVPLVQGAFAVLLPIVLLGIIVGVWRFLEHRKKLKDFVPRGRLAPRPKIERD